MDINYFSKTRILDGGMGQELLKRGLKPQGTLWSAAALIEKKYHQLVIDTHLDFINAGADVIVTTTFTARRIRLIQNKCEEHFEYVNTKAVELALKARDISKKNILVAGGLPNQYQTYSENLCRQSRGVREVASGSGRQVRPDLAAGNKLPPAGQPVMVRSSRDANAHD